MIFFAIQIFLQKVHVKNFLQPLVPLATAPRPATTTNNNQARIMICVIYAALQTGQQTAGQRHI
jgi:hypothetical protein